MKVAQLTLISDPRPWHLDDATRQVGLDGVSRARAALRRQSKPGDATPSPDATDSPSDDHDLAA